MSPYDITPTFLDSAIKDAREIAAQMVGETSFVSTLAIGICGIAMLWAFLSNILPAWSRNEPIDIWPFGRPIIVAILVGSFSTIVAQPLMFMANSIADASGILVEKSAQETSEKIAKAEDYFWKRKQEEYKKNGYWSAVSQTQQIRKEAQDLYGLARSKTTTPVSVAQTEPGPAFLSNPKGWVDNKVNGLLKDLGTSVSSILLGGFNELLFWLGMFFGYIAYTVIIIFQQIYMVILCFIGPLAFALSIFPAFQSGLYTWLAKFINVGLWSLIANILRVFTNQLRGLVPLSYDSSAEGLSTSSMVALLYVMTGLCYFFVPTLADMIVQSGGGMGNISSTVSRNAKKAAKWALRRATTGI